MFIFDTCASYANNHTLCSAGLQSARSGVAQTDVFCFSFSSSYLYTGGECLGKASTGHICLLDVWNGELFYFLNRKNFFQEVGVRVS